MFEVTVSNSRSQKSFSLVWNVCTVCRSCLLFLLVSLVITKTYLDPLKPHLYIVKQGFTGVYIIFLISAQNYRLLVLVRTVLPRRIQRVTTIYVLSRNMKNIRVFLSENFQFLEVKFSVYLNRRVFVMLGYVLWLWLFLNICFTALESKLCVLMLSVCPYLGCTWSYLPLIYSRPIWQDRPPTSYLSQ